MNKRQLLAWQVEMGADEAISNDSTDQFSIPKPEAKTPKTNTPKTAAPDNQQGLFGPQNAAELSRTLADNSDDLASLRQAVESFDGCAIKKTATNTVFCDGNPESDIMFIGEAPGAQEDVEGIPFCGASGQLLDTMLQWANFTRKNNFYISNTIFWRPPGNRKPTPEELLICRPLVEKHIALINPKLLVLVGGTAVQSLLQINTGITKLRGKFYDYTNTYLEKTIPTGVIFHPSYLLRSPGQKRYAWQDILALKQKLTELH